MRNGEGNGVVELIKEGAKVARSEEVNDVGGEVRDGLRER